MAGLALAPVSSAVSILKPVTISTGRAEILVEFAGVTGRTGDGLVRTNEREFRLAVVERLDAAPGLLAVASVALFAELPLVCVARLVAIETAPWCLSKFDFLCMTAVATRRLVSTLQLEIGQGMVERLAIELNDVGISSLVIAMARLAILLFRIRLTTVKALSLEAVSCNLFMTGQAKTCL